MNNQNTNTMKTKLTVEDFEHVLLEKESEAEYEIDNFDIDENWDEMNDLALEMTFAHFMELGYTQDEVLEVHEEYNG
jgi:flavodoxin